MTLKEIDIECEQFLKKVFGIDCDFDVEGSMIKLLREGLVEQRAASCTPRTSSQDGVKAPRQQVGQYFRL